VHEDGKEIAGVARNHLAASVDTRTMKKPSPKKPWTIEDLCNRKAHLRAVPVIVLEKWERENGATGADRIKTEDIYNELVERGVLVKPMSKQGAGNLVAALIQKQVNRNLDPYLVELVDEGEWQFNLDYYESLLREFRRQYPIKGKGKGLPKAQTERREARPLLAESEARDETSSLLVPVERALRDRQQAIEKLTKENQKIQAELVTLQAILQDERDVRRHNIVDEELRNDCVEFLKKANTYIDAIRRASVVLEERLRKAIGGNIPEKSYHGVDLVDYALRKDSGKLSVSENPAEQEGVHMLFRGAMQFVRNPPSHKKMEYTEVEAVQAIGLIDYLLLLLQHAKSK
jgi:uncharacterized protein (TIGR02391 family)